jgi:hypothetical protein
MWGCTDVDFRWRDVRDDAKILGFVDDSLAMVGDYHCWEEYVDEWNGNYVEHYGCGRDRLCVYNYRVQENGPRWCDSLMSDNKAFDFKGQFSDSVVWGGDVSSSIKLWKIGEKPHEIKLKKIKEDCSKEFVVSSVQYWLNGTFFVKGETSLTAGDGKCQYAVLDTMARTLTYKRLDDNLEWIKKCDDVRALEKDVYCLALDRVSYDTYLIVNDSVKDTMMSDEFKLGNYAMVFFMGNYITLQRTLCKYENNDVHRLTSYSQQGISFGDGKGNYITYEN